MPGKATHAFALAAIVLLLAACDTGETNVRSGNRTGVLHFGNGSEPQTLDPHIVSGIPERNIVSALLEGLVIPDPTTLKPLPGAAESWDISDDGMTYTFHLNPRARWSNGDPVTAQDFVWSWRRSLNPKMGNIMAFVLFSIKNARSFNTGEIDDPKELGVVALDEHTLQVRLERPYVYFLYSLSHPSAYPVHRATIESFGSATDRFTGWTRVENYVGNGPFKLSDWKIYRQVTVERSSSYWDAANVKLNTIIFHPVENEVAEEKMFRSGQLHVTNGIPRSKIIAYRSLTDSPYVQFPLNGISYYLVNTDHPPLDDVRVRRALAMSIDRKKLVSTILNNSVIPAYAISPDGTYDYHPPQTFEYDVEKARRFLADAGYPDGDNWPSLEILFNTSESHRQLAEAIQEMWRDALKIEVSLINKEWKVYLDDANQRHFQLIRMGLVGGADPAGLLGTFTSDNHMNPSGFKNQRFDEILTEILPRTVDKEKRHELMSEAESIIMNEMPLIPIYTPTLKYLIQPSVKGMPPNPINAYNFKRVSLDPNAAVWRWPD